MDSLDKRVANVETRNKVVETDKLWETSWTRRFLLAAFTYLAISCYLLVVGVPRPWLNGIVPAAAFMISTFTMPFFKKIWQRARG